MKCYAYGRIGVNMTNVGSVVKMANMRGRKLQINIGSCVPHKPARPVFTAELFFLINLQIFLCLFIVADVIANTLN
jgi:hypothetical protein